MSIHTHVVGPAAVEVSAASFDAAQAAMDMTVQTGGAALSALQMRWFVPGIGDVKQETQTSVAGHMISQVVLTLERFEPRQ